MADENKENCRNGEDCFKKVDYLKKPLKNENHPQAILQNYISHYNKIPSATRNSYIWKSNKDNSYNSVSEIQTSEFGKNGGLQPPPEIKRKNLVRDLSDTSIPEFTLGPMKFGSSKTKPVKPTNPPQPRYNTINPDEKGQEKLATEGDHLKNTFYTLEQNSSSDFANAHKDGRLNNEASLEAIKISQDRTSITDTPDFKHEASR